ncbi:MAG: DNA methylase [Oscillospiraceae bacterium]|nr:DNA methylase [Oscillospiraceae bacterium]
MVKDDKEKVYIAIDLKSFYASVECAVRSLDPLNTNLVVADKSRTNKTICLAVSPALKSFGIPGRPRLFEVEQKVEELNRQRSRNNKYRRSQGKSVYLSELNAQPSLEIDYLVATPQMGLYIEYSNRIYETYLKYIAPEDIHVYSIDEVFIDATNYLETYRVDAHDLAMMMIQDVLQKTKITATAGIGPNLYLCKVAMDIVAKHIPADKDGVRIAEVDVNSYRRLLWKHEPITDFWRVGRGYANRLAMYGIHTMGDVARYSLEHEDILYREFGVNAELLIDHAWGYEPCTMKDIKDYKPSSNSLSSGQVLMEPYTFEKAMIVVREMANALAGDLIDKGMVTDHVSLFVGYDTSNDLDSYSGQVVKDWFGKKIPKPAGGSAMLKRPTSSSKMITDAIIGIYRKTVNPKLLIRRLNLAVEHLVAQEAVSREEYIQTDLFSDVQEEIRQEEEEKKVLEKENDRQRAVQELKQKYGKNAVFLATSLEEGATGRQRNEQIGGHKK